MLRKMILTVLVLGLAVLLAGCGTESTSSNNSDISAEFGGYKPTDEDPAFGDEIIAAEMTDDEEFDDPMLAVTAVEDIVDNPKADLYALRIVWGKLRYDPDVTEITDWSGSLSASRGVEVLRRVIRFEPGQDYIIPRTERTSIEWVSKTTVHHDGIFVNIIIPPEDETAEFSPATVSFITGPLEITFDMNELTRLDTIVNLGNSNAVAFHGHKVERIGCPKGFLAGQWGRDETGEQIFFGKWMSQYDILKGHLQGTWGDSKFYGKYIDTDGSFEGLLKGRYHSGNSLSPMHRHAGWFRGYYYDGEGNIQGVLRGHYHECPKNSGMGFFQGRWRYYCGETPVVDDGLDD